VGLLESINRWRLERRGLSSGAKRKTLADGRVLESLERSIWVRSGLFLLFVATCALLGLQAGQGSFFSQLPAKGALCGAILASCAVLVLSTCFTGSCRRNSRALLILGGLIGHLALTRLILGASSAAGLPAEFSLLLLPSCLAPLFLGVLLGRSAGAFATASVSLLGCLFVAPAQAADFLLTSLSAGTISTLCSHRISRRLQLLKAGLLVGAVTVAVGLLLGLLDWRSCFGPDPMIHLQSLAWGAVCALATAIATALVISGVLPFFESTFHLTTDISWLEAGDLNHKLLRRMQLEAPGTFHHSLVVASLAEAAAERIGANAPMCRVCSYFHDVGKLSKPNYFIENQLDGMENPHDSLTPNMSALIITAHVKDGVDLALRHKLNRNIVEIIREHHGDSLVQFFYHRARELEKAGREKIERGSGNPDDLPNVDPQRFRYPGPRPSSRESGIVAMADAVESASRSLQNASPVRIREMVDSIFRARIQEGQLDDCPLTLREISQVKDSFATTLRSILHRRVDYPKDAETDNRTETNPAAPKDGTDDPAAGEGTERRVISLPRRA
jgi:putative nucleotidyltransferase with HDIG domain